MTTNELAAVISGIGVYLPKRVVTSEEVEEMAGYPKFGLRRGIVKALTGVEQRHYVAPGEFSSDLAANAGREALRTANLDPKDVDVVLYCSVTQDIAEPATANIVQHKIGAVNSHVFDVKNACNAALNGLDLADSLIRSGKAENILVTTGDAMSRWIKFEYEDVNELKKRSPVTFSMGDGGGAFVVSARRGADRGIKKTAFKSYGHLWDRNANWGGGVIYPRDPDKMHIPGDTKDLVDKHLDICLNYAKSLLNEMDWSSDSFVLIGSQVAEWITRKTIEMLDIPAHNVPVVVNKYGNVGAANLALAAYEFVKQGKINQGDRVLFYGGAAGFNVGCVFINW